MNLIELWHRSRGRQTYRVKGKYMIDSTSGRTANWSFKAEDSMDMVVRQEVGVPILGQGDYQVKW